MEALSAGNTVFFPGRLHEGGETLLCHFEYIGPWNIDASLNATKAHDTSIHPLPNQGSAIFDGWSFYFFGDELLMVNPKFIGAVLELAFSSGIADRTVQRMVD